MFKQGYHLGVVFIAAVLLQLCFMYGCGGPAVDERPPEKLYSAKCAGCHRLIAPEEHPPAVWHEYVYKYGKAMPVEQKERLIDYLQSEAMKTQ